MEPAKVLWTGGWDSTFQLLQLILWEKRHVKPYYLIDEKRPSTGTELLTMKKIREKIIEIDRSAEALISPTTFFSVSQIPSEPRITDAYEAVKRSTFIGEQYEWLPRYCENQGIFDLQLCIHEDDKAASVVAPITMPMQGEKGVSRVDSQYSKTNEYQLFKYFEFPVLTLTKTEMARISKERGWIRLMKMTWFCHNPRHGKPCGRCNPCKYTIEEGLARRIPFNRRLIGKLYTG